MPNGIPPDPAENRLAVRTEDHPLEYLEFHGEIPKGQYGAGTMTIWDAGTYELHKWERAQGRGHVPRRAAATAATGCSRSGATIGDQAGLDDPPDGSARRSRSGCRCPSGSCRCWRGPATAPKPERRRGRSRSSGTACARSPTCSPAGCAWRAATSTRSPTPIPRSAGLLADAGDARGGARRRDRRVRRGRQAQLRAPAAADARDRADVGPQAGRRARRSSTRSSTCSTSTATR